MKRRDFLRGLVASPVVVGVGADLVALLAAELQQHPNDIEWFEEYQDYGNVILFAAKVGDHRFSVTYPVVEVYKATYRTPDEIRSAARDLLTVQIEMARRGEPHAGHTAIGIKE